MDLAFPSASIGLSSLVWLASEGMTGLGAFAVLLGLFWGGAVALAPLVMADFFGTRAVSGIIGVLYAGVGVGALVGPVIAGLAFDLWASYTVAIVYSTAAPVLGAACVLSAEPPRRWQSHRAVDVDTATPKRLNWAERAIDTADRPRITLNYRVASWRLAGWPLGGNVAQRQSGRFISARSLVRAQSLPPLL